MIKTLISMILFTVPMAAVAQEDDEYKMEIGLGAGMTSYMGDFNGSPAKCMQPSAGLVLRRIFSPYMGLRATAMYAKLKGDNLDTETYYPDWQGQEYEFDTTLADVSVAFEYNFWPYGTGRDYRGARRVTPFVFAGIGATYAKCDSENTFTGNIPLGLGVKYKAGRRLNIGLEWAMHFSLSDKLDGVEDPYLIESKGPFKNTDCYSTLQLTVTYSFMPKCRTCNKDD